MSTSPGYEEPTAWAASSTSTGSDCHLNWADEVLGAHRPCSSEVYDVKPKPPSWATSSRRSPGLFAPPADGVDTEIFGVQLVAPGTEEGGELRPSGRCWSFSERTKRSAEGSSGCLPVSACEQCVARLSLILADYFPQGAGSPPRPADPSHLVHECPERGAGPEGLVVGISTGNQRLCDLGRTDVRALKRFHHPSVVGIRRPRRAVAR